MPQRLVIPVVRDEDTGHVTIESLAETLYGGDIVKAGVGFGRGPAAGHKYWRRVRVVKQGKLAWRYYYNTPEDRARFAADQELKRQRDNAKRAVKRAEKKVEREAASAGVAEDDHVTRNQWFRDHPELAAKRRKLAELDEAYVASLLQWSDPPQIVVSGSVKAKGDQLVAELGEDGEPSDPHGKPLHWARAAELALNLIPDRIKQYTDGRISTLEFVNSSEDDYLRRKQKVGGYCQWPKGGKSRVVIGHDRCQFAGNGQGAVFDGGLLPVCVIVHEFAHALHMKMMETPDEKVGGVSWNDWLDFVAKNKRIGRQRSEGLERGITKYAQKNEMECFTEHFAAALMYPKETASKCPRAYAFMRSLVGEDVLRPITTDHDRIEELQAELAKTDDAAEARRLRKLLDMQRGLEDMADDDPALTWWLAKATTTPITELLTKYERPNYHDSMDGFLEPEDWDRTGPQGDGRHDRFYEINYRGRTIYFRAGPRTKDDPEWKGWDPTNPETSSYNVLVKPDEIKEVYDENRQPIEKHLVWWHLNQDLYQNPAEVLFHAKVDGKVIAVTVEDMQTLGTLTRSENKATGTREQSEKMEAVYKFLDAQGDIQMFFRGLTAKSKKPGPDGAVQFPKFLQDFKEFEKNVKGRKLETREATREQFERERELFLSEVAMQPEEITAREYRQRTGTFNYDRIGMAGADIVARLRNPTLPPGERKELLARLRKEQPGVELTPVRDERGRIKRNTIALNADGTPRFNRIKYVNENPDGSKTVIWTIRGPDGQHRLEDPMWAQLLTPHGEAIRSDAHLKELMRQAVGRRTWVSIRTDRKRVRKGNRWELAKPGDEARYHHLQVEFDGSGQPKILGSQWKKALNTDIPRLDMLLSDDKVFGFKDDARAVIEAEQIRKKPATSSYDPEKGLPKIGERVILQTYDEELPGNAKGKEIVARLTNVIPGKKAGVVPDPPRWDRMPIPDDPDSVWDLEEDDDDPPGRVRLTKQEKEFRDRGLLPKWYDGRPEYREWFTEVYLPAYGKWEATKEAETAKEYPTQYVFMGEIGGGAGRKVFRRPEADLKRDLKSPLVSSTCEPLDDEVLVYKHDEIDPRSGSVVKSELRVIPPRNGSVTLEALAAMPGVQAEYEGKGDNRKVKGVRVIADEFHRFRASIGSLSLADGANQLLAARLQTEIEAKARGERADHVLPADEITPDNLIDRWGAKLQRTLPNGAKFKLADHQQRLLEKLLDNDGRVLAAHYMGTGKTVSAIVAAKMMQARPDPADPSKPHPGNPKKILIVAPLNTVEQWRQAAADFNDGALTVGSGGNDIPIEEFEKMPLDAQGDLVVVGPEYFTLHADRLKALGFDGLIVDEVHMGIKNENAERNRKVREWNADMKMLMLLTGTPMTTTPGDFVEYVRLLSNGKQWGDMDAKTFQEEYLEATDIVGELGTGKKKGPKIQVKASKRGRLATILGQWMDVALPKHVKGKTLPAVRIEDNEHAYMQGIQAQLFNLYLATAGADVDPTALADDEVGRLSDMARRAVSAAKAVANCPAYKPGSSETYIRFMSSAVDKDGKVSSVQKEFQTFAPDWLLSSKLRGKAAGKWPLAQELEPAEVQVYNAYLQHVLGASYEELAGRPITDAQLARIKEDGWPRKVENPDAGPLGIRARGIARPWNVVMDEQIAAAQAAGDAAEAQRLMDQKAERRATIDRAMAFQRAFRVAMQDRVGEGSWFNVLHDVAQDFGIEFEEAQALMQIHPVPTIRDSVVRYKVGGKEIELDADDPANRWISDTTGSLHLLYDADDWDEEAKAPRSKGGYTSLRQNDFVNVTKKGLKAAGIEKPKPPPGLTKEERARWDAEHADWQAPALRYIGGDPKLDAAANGGKLPFLVGNTGETVWIDAKEVSVRVASLMDPGKRASRLRADIAMCAGNAKADALGEHIQRFFADGGPSPDGERQMVLFGNGILDSCRTMEAKLRLMGFRDVNEVLEGSPHFDPDDPDTKDGTSPNGKYFVTYIGSTYTGDRELNVSIFQKVKDKLGRDGKTSLFVHKCMNPRGRSTVKITDPDTGAPAEIDVNWQVYPGDNDPQPVRPSAWTPDQREAIQRQFGIVAPESYVEVEEDGATRTLYYYGGALPKPVSLVLPGDTKATRFTSSADILRAIVLVGDPTKIQDPERAKNARERIAVLKAKYAEIAKAGATDAPPLTAKQESVFNNCELIVCSDAAQVGMNLGNAVEMVMYDSLGSPMAEWQRITRSARMLPPAVDDKLLGTEAKPGPFRKIRAMEAELFQAGVRGLNHGSITGLRLGPGLAEKGDTIGATPLSWPDALNTIRNRILARVDEIRANDRGSLKYVPQWQALAAKCAVAANLGGGAARSLFEELSKTPVPGGTQHVIEFPRTGIKAPTSTLGTYDDPIGSRDPVTAIREAIEALPEEDQRKIAEAGFAVKTADGAAPDPASVYLAMRAQEILEYIEAERPKVTKDMRAAAAGVVVTDADVMNRIIDSLTPEDRAILKTKKYLVNVRKLAASAHIGQVVTNAYKDEDGQTVVEKVHTGYEIEHPVRTESATRAASRARQVSFEQILADVENKVGFEIEGMFADTTATSVARISSITKSVVAVPVFFADDLKEAAWT